MEIKELFDELQKTWGTWKEVHSRLEGEIKTHGDGLAETKTMLTGLDTRLDELETKLNRRIALSAGNNSDRVESPAKTAFFEWCRKGTENLAPEHRKVMTVSDDTTGGFLAPPEYVSEMIRVLQEFSPIRSLARVRSTSAHSIKIPKKTGHATASWVAEIGTRTAQSGPELFGMVEIFTHELTAVVAVSQQDLEDSAYDIEAELRNEFTEQFAVAEATAFVTGDGVGKPLGFTDAASGITWTDTASSNVYVGDDIIDNYFRLPDKYANNATWVLRRASIGALRKLKETSTDNYIWQPGLSVTIPPTLMGRPYVEAPDMPAMGTDNNKTILFGDFRNGYLVLDRVSMSILRDPYTLSLSGQVQFVARKRVGGLTVLSEAFRGISEKA